MTAVVRIALALVAVVSAAASAQQSDSALASRLDHPTYLAVMAIVDSARAARIPIKPLFDKALEGSAKGSDGPKIVVAVQQLSARMASAKRVLGTGTRGDEIKAAAGALELGVSLRDLARLRAACGKRSVTMPLAVLTDLIGREVPIPTATDVVLQLARSGVKDGDFSLYQRNVRADIDRGADPSAAATTRARGLVLRGRNTESPTE